jgi:hypothetical protein
MLGLRTAARVARPAFRAQQPVQILSKRFESATTGTGGLGAKGSHGPVDNAFNRERQAVKDHAAGTSGTHLHLPPSSQTLHKRREIESS